MDSLDTTEIAMAVEDEFHLEIPVETMDLLLECFRANSGAITIVPETESLYIGFPPLGLILGSLYIADEILELSKTLKDSTRINRSYLR